MKRTLGIVALLVAIGVGGTVGRDAIGSAVGVFSGGSRPLASPFSKGSPLEKPYKEFAGKVMASPELKQRLRQVPQGYGPDSLVFDLGNAGLLRLDDARLETLMKMMARLFDTVDAETCAIMVRGTRQNWREFSKGLYPALELLGAEFATEWFDLSWSGIEAELKGYPEKKTVDVRQVEASLVALLERLPPRDATRLAEILDNLEGEGPADVCWAGRTIYREALRMDSANRRVLARAFATKE